MKKATTLIILCGFLTFITGCDIVPFSQNTGIVRNWLTDLKKGGDGSKYWHSSGSAEKLYAVQDWKILKETRVEDWKSIITVRVDSSTKGGSRITKNWDVEVINHEIFSVKEN